MANSTDPLPQNISSARALVKATSIALLAAAALLATVILPAEYGIDPLGTGRLLGLTSLAAPSATQPPVPPPQGEVLAPVATGAVGLYPGPFKVDAREFVLGPYEYVEYKYHLAQNATMLFSWTASGDIVHDMHGDPDGAPPSAAQSYDKLPRREADGSFTAPFSGIHGWYWENPGGDTISIRVVTAGFYAAAHEFRFDRTHLSREVRALDVIESSK
jgi:hypothetical protein